MFEKIDVGMCLVRLRPGAMFFVDATTEPPTIKWNDDQVTQPTDEEIAAEWERLKQEQTDASEERQTEHIAKESAREFLAGISAVDDKNVIAVVQAMLAVIR